MLPRSRRLNAEDLRRFRGKRVFSSAFFEVRSAPKRLQNGRFAVTVGTAVDCRSTVRHQLKRRVVARVAGWPAAEYDVHIVAFRPAAKAAPHDVLEDLDRAAGVVCGRP